jgi:tRNA(adenine34) deaminase
MPDDSHFMRIAIEEARIGLAHGEQPFGTVIAMGDTIICQTHSRKVSMSDPTAHAETLAVRAASQKLKQRTLQGCVLYTTCEPCPMCLGAMLIAGIKRLVMGARLRDLSANGVFSFGSYSSEKFAAMVGWNLEIHGGTLGAECVALYRNASVTLSR